MHQKCTRTYINVSSAYLKNYTLFISDFVDEVTFSPNFFHFYEVIYILRPTLVATLFSLEISHNQVIVVFVLYKLYIFNLGPNNNKTKKVWDRIHTWENYTTFAQDSFLLNMHAKRSVTTKLEQTWAKVWSK